MDREYFRASLVSSRDREYAVYRLKPSLFCNIQNSREQPSIFVGNKQNTPFTGKLSVTRKRLQKKTSKWLEYFSIATSNKGYEGYKDELRKESKDSEKYGEVIISDVCAFKLNWIMDGGPRYEVSSSSPLKMFGSMMFLIFQMGNYIRYKHIYLISDSTYGSVEAMFFISLWGIRRVTRFRIRHCRGFLDLEELENAFKSRKKINKGQCREKKRNKRLSKRIGKRKAS